MAIDIIHGRDPDSACELTVFVDGQRVDFTEWSFDPGAGMTMSEFDAFREETLKEAPTYLRSVLEQQFDDYRSSYERWSL